MAPHVHECMQTSTQRHKNTFTRVLYMHSHYAPQQKFIKYLVTGHWKPSLILSKAVGHNYKDSFSTNTETL